MRYTVSVSTNGSEYPVTVTPAGSYILGDPGFPASPLYSVGVAGALDATRRLLWELGRWEGWHFVVRPVGE